MAGPNTTGKPRTSDYNLGRGVLYFAALDGSGLPTNYRDLGNCSEFNITFSSEELDHQSSRTGLRVTDKSVPLSQDVSLSFILDELNDENKAILYSGSQASYSNIVGAGFAQWLMIPDNGLVAGRWYPIKNSSGARAYNVSNASLTIDTNESSPVSLDINTDYELDSVMGRLFFIPTSSKVIACITAGKGVKVDLGAGTSTLVDEVRALTQSSIIGSLVFIADNPADGGKKVEHVIHQVTLKADGDHSLIGDDWTQMSFSGKVERNEAASTTSPYITIRTPRTQS